MQIKYKKPFMVAIIINISLGIFLVGACILEFAGIINQTDYNSVYTVGVRLSHLIFISGALTLASGILSLIRFNDLRYLTLQILLGVAALAWPIFVALALFFSQNMLCIRLLPTLLASLYYIITILVVKIGNESLNKTRKIKGNLEIGKKRAQGASVQTIFKDAGHQGRAKSANLSGVMGKLSGMMQIRHSGGFMKRLFSGRRRYSHGGFMKRLFSGKRRRRF